MSNVKRENELLKYMGLSWNRCGNSLQVMLFEPTFKVESLNPAAREYRAHFEMDKAWEKVEQLWADYERLRDALEKHQWVSVEEKMPEFSKVVLCCNMKRPHEAPWVDYTGMFADGIEWCGDQDTMIPTHWMEIPPPPAAGDARENDGTAAARKEKEQAGSLEEADAPKAARKGKE